MRYVTGLKQSDINIYLLATNLLIYVLLLSHGESTNIKGCQWAYVTPHTFSNRR